MDYRQLMDSVRQGMVQERIDFMEQEKAAHHERLAKFNNERQELVESLAETIVRVCANVETETEEFGAKVQEIIPVIIGIGSLIQLEEPEEPRFDANGNPILSKRHRPRYN